VASLIIASVLAAEDLSAVGKRVQLEAAIDFIREGDTLVASLDQVGIWLYRDGPRQYRSGDR
jgi:hypothetical protein